MRFQFKKVYFGIALFLLVTEVYIALLLKSGFIRHTFGDYLVVIMMYYAIKAFTNLSVCTIAVFALTKAFIIEFLQLTPILSICNLENNKLAKIIFGTTFQLTDLLAYVLGIGTVLFIETFKNENN